MESVSKELLEKSVKALFQHQQVQLNKKEKKELFEQQKHFWLVLSFKKLYPDKVKPLKIELANSLLTDMDQVCLITKDPQSDFKELLKSKNVTSVHKVLGVTKLRNKYKQHELKRQLCQDFCMFLADDRVVPLLPKLIGKTFFEKKKVPIPVNLKKQDLKTEIDSAIQSTYFFITPGNCSSVKVGHTEMESDKIVENIMTALPDLAKKVPGGWENIQSIHLKLNDSVALPLFTSTNEYVTEEEERQKRREKKEKRKLEEVETPETKKRKQEEKVAKDHLKRLLKTIKLKV